MNSKCYDRDFLTAMLAQWRNRLGLCSMFVALPAIAAAPSGNTTAAGVDSIKENPAAERIQTRASRRGFIHSQPDFLRRQGSFRLRDRPSGPTLTGLLAGTDDCPGRAIPPGTYTAGAPYSDSGDTTGANNTVTRTFYIFYQYYWYDSPGADHVYNFTITGRGPNPRIEVQPTTATYAPAVYVLGGRTSPGCPSGTDHTTFNQYVYSTASAGQTAVLNNGQVSHLPLNSPLYLFVDGHTSGASSSGAYTLKLQDVTIAERGRAKYDFTGDGRADITVFRPSEGTWYVSDPPAGFSKTQFGTATDKIVPADYDNDGKTDIAIFRDGQWWLLYSGDNSVRVIQFGLAGDVPVPADFTGDGRSEIAVFRDGQWWILDLATGQTRYAQFGQAGDKPFSIDYDHDGRADIVVYREGRWYLYGTRWGGPWNLQLGMPGDIPVPADYDGDTMTDLAVYRNGTWLQYRHSVGEQTYFFGSAGDIPVPADYDGDGKADLAFFRDGVWHVEQTTGGLLVRQFGLPDDRPAIATP